MFGFSDLTVGGEYYPFNEEKLCQSLTGCERYRIPEGADGRNMLTNQRMLYGEHGIFRISEIEVWGVKFQSEEENMTPQ